jgi:hypothetical protein
MTMLQFRTRLRVLAPFRRLMVAVFCVALTVRLGVFFWLYGIGGEQQFLFGDSLRYLSLADSTLAGAGYMYDGILETFRLPGYPAFFYGTSFASSAASVGFDYSNCVRVRYCCMGDVVCAHAIAPV